VENTDTLAAGRIRFNALAEHYLRVDFGTDAVCPKSEGTTLNMQHIVRDYLTPRFGGEIAEEIKPLDIQRWLKSLHTDKKRAWTTVSKIRGVMLRVYKIGIQHELVSRNPLQSVETRSKTDYRAIVLMPQQTRAILRTLSCPLHRILVLTCAATALRASELVAIRWADLQFDERRIRISKSWSPGKMAQPRRRARTAMFRCIPAWLAISKRGASGRRTGKTQILCSLPSRRTGNSPFQQGCSWPIICVRSY